MAVISDKQIAMEGLKPELYPVRWRDAERLATSNERTDDARLLPYWERVRLLYLEMGGR